MTGKGFVASKLPPFRGALLQANPPSVRSPNLQGDPLQHATWLASRPRRFEQNAVRALLSALRATAGSKTKPGFLLHIVHLSGEAWAGWRKSVHDLHAVGRSCCEW